MGKGLFYLYCLLAVGLFVLTLVVALREIFPPTESEIGFFDHLRDVAQRFYANFKAASALLLATFVAVFSIPLVLYRTNLQIKQQEVAEAAQEVARRNFEETRDTAIRANITDRLLRATELLGVTHTVTRVRMVDTEQTANGSKRAPVTETVQIPNIEVRIGALHLLEQLAKEPAPGTEGLVNHGPILTTITAYLRERQMKACEVPGRELIDWAAFEKQHGPEPKISTELNNVAPQDEAPPHERAEYARRKRDWLQQRLDAARPIPEDVATAIAFLRRRDENQLREELQQSDLPDAVLYDERRPLSEEAPLDQRLAHARAKKAHIDAWPAPQRPLSLARTPMHAADLRGIDARKQDLREARLEGANLKRARLDGADLWRARLGGADLWEARLDGANLWEARLDGADLWLARLDGADLRQARLDGAHLWGARLDGAELWGARLDGAELWEARLDGADLRRARLDGADLREARLDGASLLDAVLVPSPEQGVDADAPAYARNLVQAQLDSCFGHKQMRLPNGLSPPEHWTEQALSISDAERAWADWRRERGLPTLPRHEKFDKEQA